MKKVPNHTKMLKTSRWLPLAGVLSSALLFFSGKAVAGLIEYTYLLLIYLLVEVSSVSVPRLNDSALVASQFEGLRVIAEDVLVLTETSDAGPPVLVTGTSGLLVDALAEAEALIMTAQDGQQPPDPEKVTAVLKDLATAEAALQQDLATLENPASARVAGELEAYLNLKHDLQEVVAEVKFTEIKITETVDKASVKIQP